MNEKTVGSIDPITLAVVWGGLQAVAQEMGIVLKRTAYSSAVREGEDFSPAIFDADGRLIAQGDFSPGHLGSMPFAVKRIAGEYPPETLKPGDAILQNDPEIGSGHLPDFFVFYPVFHEDQLIGWTVNCAHQSDVGGLGLGSTLVERVSEYYEEGLRILPIKLYEAGKANEAVMKIIAANVRLPEVVLGDLQAQLNACRVGAIRFQALAGLYGLDTLKACTEEIMDRSEAAIRAAVRDLEDGTYEFEDYLDDCGRDTDPIRIKVAATIKGDDITIDLAGSSPQTKSGMNSYFNYTFAYIMAAVKAVTDPGVPQNEGCTRPLKVMAPRGSFFNPIPPVACGGRHIACNRIFEATMGAMAQAAPSRAFAASSQTAVPVAGGVNPKTGRRFYYYDLILGGIGGRCGKDGIEAIVSPWNARNIPAEVHEISSPLIIESLGFVPDTGGPGKYRGGMAIKRDVRFLGDRMTFFNMTERQKFDPWGLFGGKPGTPGRTLLNPGPNEQVLHSKGIYDLNPGDLVRMQTSGSGGYGDPLERDPDAVREDVDKGFVSLEAAAKEYGVVIDPGTLAVDAEATDGLRASLRRMET